MYGGGARDARSLSTSLSPSLHSPSLSFRRRSGRSTSHRRWRRAAARAAVAHRRARSGVLGRRRVRAARPRSPRAGGAAAAVPPRRGARAAAGAHRRRRASPGASLGRPVADSAVGASSAAERRSVWASSRACNRMQQRLQPYPKQRAPSGPVAAPAGLRSASPNPDPGPKPKQAAPAGLRRAPSPRPSSSGRRVGRCA